MTQVIVALDVSTVAEAEHIVTSLEGQVSWFKVGLQLFMAHGMESVHMVRHHRAQVFLDLKFHDIPQTVANAVREAARMGVDAVSLHLAGGQAMVSAAAEVPNRPKLWGVSVLTSLTNDDLKVLGGRTTAELVPDLARGGMAWGLDGVVCSGLELPVLSGLNPRPTLVVPGVRMADDAVADQKRVISPADAAKGGADFVVVGRPITQAQDRSAAAKKILAALEA